MEQFKKFDQLTEPDVCNKHWVNGRGDTITLKDYYDGIKVVTLIDAVPGELHSQFNVAKNIFVYSWFVYAFHPIAEMKAFSALELALKMRFKNTSGALRNLLELAVSSGIFHNGQFAYTSGLKDSARRDACLQGLAAFICDHRNALAHGSDALHPWSADTLGLCADLINQIFREGTDL